MQTAELVFEHSSKSMLAPVQLPAGIKTILFHVHDDDSLDQRIQAGLSIARAFGAHLHLLHVTPIEAYTVTDAFATYVNADIVSTLESEAAKLKSRLERQLTKEDVSWEYEELTGSLMPHLIQRAALADLVITGREPHERDFGGPAISLIGDMLHNFRTPLLVLADETKDIDLFGPAIIAWNGSYEAANAMRCAVPLLKLASDVRLVTIEEKKDNTFPITDALEYLSRHDIHAELVEPLQVVSTVEEEIVGQAQLYGARYIVMGGYSHSRAGEFLFGGVTRALLKDCPIPLFVAR